MTFLSPRKTAHVTTPGAAPSPVGRTPYPLCCSHPGCCSGHAALPARESRNPEVCADRTDQPPGVRAALAHRRVGRDASAHDRPLAPMSGYGHHL